MRKYLATKFRSGEVSPSDKEILDNLNDGLVSVDTITEKTPGNGVTISTTSALRLPVGTAAQQPTGATGMVRYNTTSSSFEGFDGTAWSGLGGGGTTDRFTQASPSLAVGNVVYLDGTVYRLADASAANTAEVVGVVSRSLGSNVYELTLIGEVANLTASNFQENLLPASGEVLFLSASAPGKLTITEPSVIGQVSIPVGIASGSGTVYVAPKRGVVVGSANARTQINLGGSTGSSVTTPIQNVSAYEAGELAGWVVIDATTDYKFYFQSQFAKNPSGTGYNIAVPQTVGSTPPVGFSMDVVSGVVQVTLPALAGFVSAYVNFAINAPAVGASLPLSINSTSVYTTYKAVTSAYTITTSDSLIVASGAGTYAVTLPTAVGALGTTYTIKSAMNAGVNLTVNTTSSQLIDTVTSRTLAVGEVLEVVSDGAKWVIVVSEQDVTATASPTFTGAKVSGLAASRAVQTDASKNLTSVGFSLPATSGTNLQLLKSNGDGTSSWTTSIYNTTVTVTSPTLTLDASTGNSFIHAGSVASRTLTITNLADGQTININVQGANGNVISWTTATLTQKTGITYSNTMTSANSIFTLSRFGSNVFISSLHGFG